MLFVIVMTMRKEIENPVLIQNKKAWHDFEIIEKLEAGIELKGTEVKSCRSRNLSMTDTFAKVENAQMFLYNLHISPYECGNIHNHDPKRIRRLLLHKREILKLFQQSREKGLSIVPLKVYLRHGKIKVEIGLCKGKNKGDKRESLKRKEDELSMRKAIKGF